MASVEPLRAQGMLLLGSESRNAGKTILACRIIAAIAAQRPINAFKVTVLDDDEPVCARGTAGCDACAGHPKTFCLAPETSSAGPKDTQRLLAAGASAIFWLRALPPHLEAGARALVATLGGQSPSVGESNRLRTCVVPDLFLMVRRPGAAIKPTVEAVRPYVDCLITSDGHGFDLDLERLHWNGSRWTLGGLGAARPAGSQTEDRRRVP